MDYSEKIIQYMKELEQVSEFGKIFYMVSKK